VNESLNRILETKFNSLELFTFNDVGNIVWYADIREHKVFSFIYLPNSNNSSFNFNSLETILIISFKSFVSVSFLILVTKPFISCFQITDRIEYHSHSSRP
jgi:hypothetical protein